MHNPFHWPQSRALRWSLMLLSLILFIGLVRVGQIAFDSRVSGVRAPYLQMVGPTSAVVRWEGERMVRGRVRYGASPGQLNKQALEAQASTHHEVHIEGLKPYRKYYYAVDEGEREAWAAGPARWFVTAPGPKHTDTLRLWVIGDPGYDSSGSERVRAAASYWFTEHPRTGLPALDLWLSTGDNAYRSGSNAQFETGLFQPYADWLIHQPLWPVYGNHDARRRAFFDIFTLPEWGELGGLPSGTEHYYSFNYGPLHLVMLDSQASDTDRYGAMAQWLKADLLLNEQPWTLVLFHHPPYTKGSHDSDSLRDSGGRMVEMRERIVPLLEKSGVDLVLSGHSHVYERSHLIACHYGDSTSLQPWMMLDQGGAEANYHKAPGAWQGTIYAVVGSSAKLDNGPLNHPVMANSLRERGSLVLEVEGQRLVGRFINADGMELDHFTLSKDLPAPRPLGDCVIPEHSAAW